MFIMNDNPTVTILGTGYVGLTTAALFATAGIKTYVVDTNEVRLESVRQGKSFFFEEGLDLLVTKGVTEKMLIPTTSYKESVSQSSVVISSVGTPDNPDGSSNLSYIFAAATEAINYLQPGATYVQKSTVPVGTGARIKKMFADASVSVSYVSNPEFLRESTAVPDTLWFDRVVLGGDDQAAIEKVRRLYRHVETARDTIVSISGIQPPVKLPRGEYIITNLESAELIKVVSNAFLALKISFANSIALLADKVGADVTEVMDAVGADQRIGRDFLQAGRGYGGGCFPKDVSGLLMSGLEMGVDLSIIRAAQVLNDGMPAYILEKMQDKLDGSLQGKTVAVLGLSFKPHTSDVRRSFGVQFSNDLVELGAHVRAFDPEANDDATKVLRSGVTVMASLDAAVANADAVVIATDWPLFLSHTPEAYGRALVGNKLFVDAMNRFDVATITEAGLCYIGVGRH
jgi:UDPglucose 6-dehydrogenase